MKELIIVGAGGFGRELLQWAKEVNYACKKWKIKGFVDDNLNSLNGFDCEYKVLGTIKEWSPCKKEVFAMGIAEPKIKEKIVKMLKEKNAQFTDVIHPLATIGDYNSIGEGLVAYPKACITVNTKIGSFVTLLSSNIGHDAEVGDYSTISSFCDITDSVKIGKRVFMGTHSSIVPRRKIGDDAFICAGSLVVTHLKEKARVMGNPAKNIFF